MPIKTIEFDSPQHSQRVGSTIYDQQRRFGFHAMPQLFNAVDGAGGRALTDDDHGGRTNVQDEVVRLPSFAVDAEQRKAETEEGGYWFQISNLRHVACYTRALCEENGR